jgi:hypothetical protein
MGSIYRVSFCTLAAHTAEDSAAGFLQSSLDFPESVCLGGNSDAPGDATFTASLPVDFMMDVDNSALSKRAWVLQERLLPPSIIHFTPSRIYIESSGSLETVSEKGIPISEDSKSTRPTIPGLSSPAKESPLNWLDIFERYTRCGLTFEKDKLIAIAALAKPIHLSTGVPYFSGLWQNCFHMELLWVAKGSNKRHKEIVGPSWSWAPVSGPVVFPKAFTSMQELIRCSRQELK